MFYTCGDSGGGCYSRVPSVFNTSLFLKNLSLSKEERLNYRKGEPGVMSDLQTQGDFKCNNFRIESSTI